MGRAKDITIGVIKSSTANNFVKKHHYSGKIVNNSQLHFGAFLDGKLHGVMSFGPSLDKRKIQGLVKDTGWNEFLELNRMAFDDVLPRNAESRCISLAIKAIKKNAPHVKWIVSFADGTQCGDGTIYRASNFLLTGITENKSILQLPDGSITHKFTLYIGNAGLKPRPELGGKSFYEVTNGSTSLKKYMEVTGAKTLKGYQFRYIYFIDKKMVQNLKVPVIPYSEIDRLGAGMYKGEKVSITERKAISPTPTPSRSEESTPIPCEN